MKWRALPGALCDVLLPDQCVLCHTVVRPRPADLLCAACRDALPLTGSACRHCALPLAAPGVCGACSRRPLTTGVAVSALLHDGEARYLVHRLKFAHGMREARTLAYCLVRAVRERYTADALPELVVPTPMSWRATVRRGHNQAVALAEYTGRVLAVPRAQPLRRRHAPPQRSLGRRDRLQLRPDAFRVARPVTAGHVALVDDVLTTGATARAMVAVLRAAGVARVDVWCATRAVLP